MQELDPHRQWFVYAQGKEVGPIKEVELRHRILTGNLEATSHAYTEGMTDWRPLGEISGVKELFVDTLKSSEQIPYSKNALTKKNSDRARALLISASIIFVAAIVYYFWDPTAAQQLAQKQETAPVKFETVSGEEDPFTHKDWAELKNYRHRKDIVGSGFVLARDNIDEEFPVLKGAVSTNIAAGEIDYRIYPVPGAHLMPLPKILQGKTSVVNGYFVIGPLSDAGNALPTGKYRLIARADHIYLGEVTLQRGHLPEGIALQKEEEKLKVARFEKITTLKALYSLKLQNIENLLKDIEKLKAGALNPGTTNPADFSALARLTLEKFRDERLSISSLENELILLGPASIELLQVVDNLWTPLSTAFAEFPNPDPQRFVSIDSKSIIEYLHKIRMKAMKVATEEIAQRSEGLLNEEIIKKTLMNDPTREGSAVR